MGIYFKNYCGTEHCEQKNLCNSGTCVAKADSPGYSCTCPDGFGGDNCEIGFFNFS